MYSMLPTEISNNNIKQHMVDMVKHHILSSHENSNFENFENENKLDQF